MRATVAGFLIAVGVTCVGGGGAASAQSTMAVATPFSYVALGDSYSAGEGVAPYLRDVNRCHRSSRAYSTWVKRRGDATPLYAIASGGGKPGTLGGKNKYGSDSNVRSAAGVRWASWACSGAVTKNVLPKSLGGVPQQAAGQIRDPGTQLDSANLSRADLVTITIGGNDVGFVDGLYFCALQNCRTPAFEQGRRKRIDAVEPRLVAVYAAIAKRAPTARILVLGYPQVFPATPAEQTCFGLIPFLGEQDMLRRLGTYLNATIAAAAREAAKADPRIEYVPVAGRFAGHEVCGRRGPWLNGIALTTIGNQTRVAERSFHPTLQGQQQGYGGAINAVLARAATAP